MAVGHHIFQNGKTFQIAHFQSMLVVYLPIQVLIPKFSLPMKYHKNEAESLLFSISPTVTKTVLSNANEIVMFAMLNTGSTTSQFTEHWKNFQQQPETRILILLHFRLLIMQFNNFHISIIITITRIVLVILSDPGDYRPQANNGLLN